MAEHTSMAYVPSTNMTILILANKPLACHESKEQGTHFKDMDWLRDCPQYNYYFALRKVGISE